jgi:hypothetical protein
MFVFHVNSLTNCKFTLSIYIAILISGRSGLPVAPHAADVALQERREVGVVRGYVSDEI